MRPKRRKTRGEKAGGKGLSHGWPPAFIHSTLCSPFYIATEFALLVTPIAVLFFLDPGGLHVGPHDLGCLVELLDALCRWESREGENMGGGEDKGVDSEKLPCRSITRT